MDVVGTRTTKIVVSGAVVAFVLVAGYAALTRYQGGFGEPAKPVVDLEPPQSSPASEAPEPAPDVVAARAAKQEAAALTREVYALVEAERELPVPRQRPEPVSTPESIVVNVSGHGQGPVTTPSYRSQTSAQADSVPGMAANDVPADTAPAVQSTSPSNPSNTAPSAPDRAAESGKSARSSGRTALGNSVPRPSVAEKTVQADTDTPTTTANDPTPATQSDDQLLSTDTLHKVAEADRLVQQLIASGQVEQTGSTRTTQDNRQSAIQALRADLDALKAVQ